MTISARFRSTLLRTSRTAAGTTLAVLAIATTVLAAAFAGSAGFIGEVVGNGVWYR